MEKDAAIHDVTPEGEATTRTENDLEADDEYYRKYGVVRPPAPPPGYGQSGVQQLAARLKTQTASGSTTDNKPLSVAEKPLKALVALVVQMQFGSADKAELLIAELLGIACICCLKRKWTWHLMKLNHSYHQGGLMKQ